MKCSSCKFFETTQMDEDVGQGWCMRYAPQGTWPMIDKKKVRLTIGGLPLITLKVLVIGGHSQASTIGAEIMLPKKLLRVIGVEPKNSHPLVI